MIGKRLLPSSRPFLRSPGPLRSRTLATAPAQAQAKNAASGVRSAVVSTALLAGTAALLYYAHDSRAGIHKWLIMPAAMVLTADDAERAHELAVQAIGSGFAPVDKCDDDARLAVEVFGKQFSNPLGMAAGFDKNAAAIDGLFKLGFGYVEIGSVTPEPQPGNPKPRVFRIPETQSVVNRYGFNSEGHAAVLLRLRNRVRNFVAINYASLPPIFHPPPPEFPLPNYDPCAELLKVTEGVESRLSDELSVPRSLRAGKVLGINLGKNKSSDPDSIDDFVNGVKTFGPFADVLVINVSSPNTPGLRSLQRKGMLEELLEGVVSARNGLHEHGPSRKPPVLVKVAPDLGKEELEDIAKAVQTTGVDGIIVSNTTISRPSSAGTSPTLAEAGGLSGPPVKPLALAALSALYKATDGKVTLIGCGGISSGEDALEYAKAGASLVQLYTSFVYGGVGLPRRIKDELTTTLSKENTTWAKVVGSGVRKETPPPLKPVAPEPAKAAPAAPAPKEVDFETGLKEAKLELEELLQELAHVASSSPAAEKTPPPAATPLSVPPTLETALPAPVAESLPAGIPTPTSTPAPETPIANPLAIPANALLDQQQIAVMLDPATAQVKSEVVATEEKEKAERPQPSLHDGKRWV